MKVWGKHWTYRVVLGLFVLLLVCCRHEATVPSSKVPTIPPESTTAPMTTSLSTISTMRRLTNTPMYTLTPLRTRTPTPTPTTKPDLIGPFAPLPPDQIQPSGTIYDWRVAIDGTLWLVTGEGVASFHHGTWTLHPKHGTILIGFDEAGRTWLISEEGDSIAAWDGTTWTTYGSKEGWTDIEQAVRRAGPYPTISEEIITDRRGWVWFVTQKDVRVFNGQQWSIYGPEEVGFTRTDEMVDIGFGFLLTDVAIDSTGDVWVADCAWMGPGPRGQGARWFNGKEWWGQNSPVVGSGCIKDIEVDAAGRIWAGVDGDLWRYTPGEGWTVFPHPEPDSSEGRRWGWIADLELGGEETVWVTMSPCGGASCDSGVFILYRVHNGIWTQVSEEGPGDLALDSNGEGWLCLGDGLYRIVEDTVEPILGQDSRWCSVEADPTGRFWLRLQSQTTFWLYDKTGDD